MLAEIIGGRSSGFDRSPPAGRREPVVVVLIGVVGDVGLLLQCRRPENFDRDAGQQVIDFKVVTELRVYGA